MGQVFNVSNKHQLFNKSAKNIISAKRLHIPPSFPKQLVSIRGVFRTQFEHQLFAKIFDG